MTSAIQLPVFNQSGEPSGTVEAPAVLAMKAHRHIIYQAVIRQLANARVGTSSTLTKGEVRGGGKKPWKQKHTGRARQGSIRSPQWRHGGIVFGPKPRKYTQDMPVRARRLALRSVLAAKARAGQVSVLEALVIDPPKTRGAAALLKKMSVKGRVLIVIPAATSAAALAFRNLVDAKVESAASVSVYDILNARHVVVLQEAMDALVNRCTRQPARGKKS